MIGPNCNCRVTDACRCRAKPEGMAHIAALESERDKLKAENVQLRLEVAAKIENNNWLCQCISGKNARIEALEAERDSALSEVAALRAEVEIAKRRLEIHESRTFHELYKKIEKVCGDSFVASMALDEDRSRLALAEAVVSAARSLVCDWSDEKSIIPLDAAWDGMDKALAAYDASKP